MIFKKKKRMVDVRELQRRGVVRIPRENVVVPTDSTGFVELGATKTPAAESTSETPATTSSSNADFFGFVGNSSPSSTESTSGVDGYGKRDVDEKVVNLDNKIYKLEQRIELLEKKLDVGKPADTNVGVMGW